MTTQEQPLLTVRISKAAEVVWEGRAQSVSSENAQGPFDILPMHANFITLLSDKPIVIIAEDGEKIEKKFSASVMYVVNDVVKIYADIANIS
jgi:F0F1-type ATP synthase epsilon subunit